ncbi:MAG: cyclic nucleotide-binding domain-containing protein [Rubrivivax sp.]
MTITTAQSTAAAASSPAAAPDRAPKLNLQQIFQAVQTSQGDRAVALQLSGAQWRALGAALQRRTLVPGERLMERGDRGDTAFVLESGGLQVFVDGGGIRPTHRIELLERGAVVGEPALFEPCVRMATVEATCDSVVWGLSAAAFAALMASDPLLGLGLMRAAGAVMARRMRANLDRGLPVA